MMAVGDLVNSHRNFRNTISIGIISLLLSGCGYYGTDYCKAESRRLTDREKIVRQFMEQYNGKYSWQRLQGAKHFSAWMAHVVRDINNKKLIESSINEYLDRYPRFVQLVGRQPFVEPYDPDKYLDAAVEQGYYADIVVVYGPGSEYPLFVKNGSSPSLDNGYYYDRYGITSCGKFINWQRVGD